MTLISLLLLIIDIIVYSFKLGYYNGVLYANSIVSVVYLFSLYLRLHV